MSARYVFPSHYWPVDRKPPVALMEELLHKVCACGAEFDTQSRLKHRCDLCQLGVVKAKQKKWNVRLREQRRLERQNRGAIHA